MEFFALNEKMFFFAQEQGNNRGALANFLGLEERRPTDVGIHQRFGSWSAKQVRFWFFGSYHYRNVFKI